MYQRLGIFGLYRHYINSVVVVVVVNFVVSQSVSQFICKHFTVSPPLYKHAEETQTCGLLYREVASIPVQCS